MTRPTAKFVVLLAAVAACMVVLHATPLRRYLSNVQWAHARLEAAGPAGAAAFVGLGALLVAAGLPRLAVCATAGAVYGFSRGFALSHAASMAGAYLTFLFARWAGRDWVVRRTRHRHSLLRFLSRKPSVTTVAMIRQLPVHALILNLTLGVSPVSHPAFVLGSLIGMIPGSAAAALIGSGIGQPSLRATALRLSAAAAVFLLAALVFAHRRRTRRPADPAVSSP